MITMRIRTSVQRDDWLTGPLTDFFNAVMLEASGDASEAGVVPIDKARLRGSLQPGAAEGTTRIDRNKPPLWAEVGTNVDYGGALEKSNRTHYRRGPSKGKPTKGWLSNSADRTAAKISRKMGAPLAKALEDSWHKSAR